MNRLFTLIGSTGLGSGLMYLADPDRGKRRRALLRDQLVHGLNVTDRAIDKTVRDLGNRSYGLLAEARYLLSNGEVPDDVLVARVRSKLGRVVSHPGSIWVTADRGLVTLSGPVLTDEVDRLVATVSTVPGVADVENRLEVHEHEHEVLGWGGTPAKRPGAQFDLLQTYWSPTSRLFVGTTGAVLAQYGLRHRGLLGAVAGTTGLVLLTRAVTNLTLARLLGFGGGRRAIDLHKTTNVNAPVEQVFEYWTNFENLPYFMGHLNEVRDLGGGLSHWVATGPAGVSFEWDAVVTKMVPNQEVAWKSVPGAVVANAGRVQFQSNPDGSTRLDIHLSYNPPGGVLGHTVASLFGADPKHAMDEDLVRFKSLIEQGKTTAHGRTVTRDELEGRPTRPDTKAA